MAAGCRPIDRAEREGTLFPLLKRIENLPTLPEPLKGLTFPELLLRPSKQKEAVDLNPKDPLFVALNEMISLLKEHEEVDPALKSIGEIYQGYIDQVVAVHGKERRRLLKGPVRLFTWMRGEAVCLLLPQKRGRELALSESGRISIFSNREGYRALSRPDWQRSVALLNSLIFSIETPSPSLVKVSNLFLKSPERRAAFLIYHSGELPGDPLDQLLDLKNSSRITNRLTAIANQREFSRRVLLDLITFPRGIRSSGFEVMLPVDGRREIRAVTCGDLFQPSSLCRTTTFLLDPLMSLSLDLGYSQKIAKLDVDSFLIDWLAELSTYNSENEQLIRGRLFTRADDRFFRLTARLPSTALASIRERLKTIQSAVKEDPQITHWELLEKVDLELYQKCKALSAECGGDYLEAEKRLFNGELKGEQVERLLPHEALERWIATDFRRVEPERQEGILKQLFTRFPDTATLELNHPFPEESLLSVLEYGRKVTHLILSNQEGVRVETLARLMEERPRLTLTLKERGAVGDLAPLVRFAREQRCTLSIGSSALLPEVQREEKLAEELMNSENYREAADHYRVALTLYEQLHGEAPHSDLSSCLNHLGCCYREIGDYAKAIECHQRALAMDEKIHQEGLHIDIALSLNNLGNGYDSSGEHLLAIDCHKRALAIKNHHYQGQPDRSIAISLMNLGVAYAGLKEHRLAIQYYRDSWEMLRNLHGDLADLDVAANLTNLGVAETNLGDYEGAAESFRIAAMIYERVYGDQPNLDLARILRGQATSYGQLGDFEQAIACSKKAQDIYIKLVSESDPELKELRELMSYWSTPRSSS